MDQRLVQISDQFRHIFNSPILVGAAAIYRGFGLLPCTLQKYIMFLNYGTVFHTNFSTFKENKFELFGNPVEQIVPNAGLLQGSCSMSVVSISYCGKMGITITADKALFGGKDELERVINDIVSEISEIEDIGLQRREVETSLV
ncbi:hypothetical protein Fcan01_00156 [Folsomia candida]|uniref:O-acyltransferase WSD1 C-terminal domain-containing protein n=1 Tax=Folsomia candida TaxID=158441 RepID=A0A226EY17_FOLCA|nr:hypothetical protein Fcan01_00156 [Folsomia candida]